MGSRRDKPLIVQSDRRVFLEVRSELFEEARDRLMMFAELEKSPEHVHIYRLTPISLWNAAAGGIDSSEIVEFLTSFSRFPVPGSLRKEIEEFVGRYGLVQLHGREDGTLTLDAGRPEVLDLIRSKKHLSDFFLDDEDGDSIVVKPEHRGALKLALVKMGFPVEDLAGYQEGMPFRFDLRERLAGGEKFVFRKYQQEAIDAFYAGGSSRGGSGVVVLPCGAGKTIVGIGVLHKIGCQALVLSTNITSLRQWKRELLDKTEIPGDCIGEYSGEQKQIRPITLSTYQILTYRKSRLDGFVHFDIFSKNEWGLIVYDEVHLLPAPVFRCTAQIQATRRLGLTATLVREDGREAEVFSLIGPRKYDLPWRALEGEGWIANAECLEIRAGFDASRAKEYEAAGQRQKFRLASENPRKLDIIRHLVKRHARDHVLVIGQYLDQLRSVSENLKAPLITGKTPHRERERLFGEFREGEIPLLIVSKVGNFAVDLPDANVAIQISGTFGSRQEEAQRLGRILRPKSQGGPALFYSIVTRASRDQEFAEKRQLFLTEQGYRYMIMDSDELFGTPETKGPPDPLTNEDTPGYRAAECS